MVDVVKRSRSDELSTPEEEKHLSSPEEEEQRFRELQRTLEASIPQRLPK